MNNMFNFLFYQR